MNNKIDRRQFVQSTAAIGAGLLVGSNIPGATASSDKKNDINVALIGAGIGGQILFDAAVRLGSKSGIKFKAVCDIWDYNRDKMARKLGKYQRWGFNDAAYVDYKEMLDREKGNLDAVIIATPDCFHAEQTNACLKAGLHVYCEKGMSNTIEGAKSMVVTARETGKRLQIGHQRRSNPRYLFAKKNVIDKKFPMEIKNPITGELKKADSTLLGRITTINGQWNRDVRASSDLGWPAGTALPPKILAKYGFKNMQQFRNWRWYKGLGCGPVVDLGANQIDVFSWFLGEARPKSVVASGGIDYWTGREWYDSVMAAFEFDTKEGPVRALYQINTTSSSGGYYEKFMGLNGTLEISENPKFFKASRQWRLHANAWKPWVDEDIISIVAVSSSPPPPLAPYNLNTSSISDEMKLPYHAPHIANFFDAIRDKNVKLNCPAEVGYRAAVMALKINEAVASEKMIKFKDEEFEV